MNKILIIFLIVIVGFVSYFLVNKVFGSFEERLCEKYAGEWLLKEILEDGDACEFAYYSIYEGYYVDEQNKDFYLQEYKKRISSKEEKHEKEINIAKKYCMEVGGKFMQGTVESRFVIPEIHEDWVVRCYTK